MKYFFSYSEPQKHFIDIKVVVENISADTTEVCLPAWRPGRYELGNFAKNIQKFSVYGENKHSLHFEKTAKDRWKIDTKNQNKITIEYNYYASELNAGSTYLDEKQLYVNPVNCCLYIAERINEKCEIALNIPDNYVVATGLKQQKKNIFIANDFHELSDCPFIASDTLKHDSINCNGIDFNIWIQGESKPDWEKIKKDFSLFIHEQLKTMKEFPANEYHFLFQILPVKYYHGVEHINSTVIALGPSYNLMKDALYMEMLGVSSHELFHSWNIKSIRPAEMFPYDYSKENYSKLGYVAEGVTTYYGDLFLYRSGVFSDFDYFRTLHESLQKHYDNFGRYNLSVAASSFDTWLDGYGKGIPGRKVSIYTEGSLLAFASDIIIRRNSNDKYSLDDVMRNLYFEYYKKNKGYTETDYKNLLEKFSGVSFDVFFTNYVWGTESYEPLLKDCLNYIGCELISTRSRKYHEAFWGLKIEEPRNTISGIFPDSPADKSGFWIGDEIIAINGFQLNNDLNEWCKFYKAETVTLTVKRSQKHIQIPIAPNNAEVFYKINYISKSNNANEKQKEAFRNWAGRGF
jgi:predicted metalloprotease with PDZ domain